MDLRRTTSAHVLVALVSATACSPDSEVVGTLDTSSGGTTAATTTGASADGSDPSASSSAGATTASSSTDTGNVDGELCSSADAASCPDGCAVVQAWWVHDDNCSANPVDVCVLLGEAPSAVPTMFWIEAPDGPRFVEVGGCGMDAQPAEGWRECGSGDPEPIDCECFCSQGLCAGDADRLALEACGLDPSCPDVSVDSLSGTVDVRAEACVLEALADRVPGLYTVSYSGGFVGGTRRFYVDDAGVQIISGSFGDVPSCPTTSGWSDASRCELAPSEYFTACLDQLGTEQDCALTSDQWTTGCVEQTPTCP